MRPRPPVNHRRKKKSCHSQENQCFSVFQVEPCLRAQDLRTLCRETRTLDVALSIKQGLGNSTSVQQKGSGYNALPCTTKKIEEVIQVLTWKDLQEMASGEESRQKFASSTPVGALSRPTLPRVTAMSSWKNTTTTKLMSILKGKNKQSGCGGVSKTLK